MRGDSWAAMAWAISSEPLFCKVGGNPGSPKRVAADSGGHADGTCSALDHAKCIAAAHRSIRKPARLTASAAEERRLGFTGNSRSFEVGIEKLSAA